MHDIQTLHDSELILGHVQCSVGQVGEVLITIQVTFSSIAVTITTALTLLV